MPVSRFRHASTADRLRPAHGAWHDTERNTIRCITKLTARVIRRYSALGWQTHAAHMDPYVRKRPNSGHAVLHY